MHAVDQKVLLFTHSIHIPLISVEDQVRKYVTGMKIAVPARSAGIMLVPAYGATIRDEGHREHAKWAGRCTR